VIEVDGVAVELGGERVLDAVSLDVAAGEFVGLVGPNGAGKTTLLRTVNGALAPDAGSVTVRGEDVHALSSRAASRLVATVPQTTELSFDFDVRQTVEMGRTPHRSRLSSWRPSDREAVDRAMERTAVASLADRPVTAVSGGERKRVLLARALAQETPVMLLDEPTASLDINHQVRTLELVSDLVREGTTAVAAIHDLDLAARYCDRLALLADGRVLASGPPDEVLTGPRLRAAFDVDAVVSRHPVTGAASVTARPDGPRDAAGRVHVVGGGGTAGRLLARLSAAGYDLTAGALPAGDADAETARALGADVVTVPPHAPVDEAAAERVRELVSAADAVVVAPVPVSEGTLPNLAAAADAAGVVVVSGRPLPARNHAGAAGEAAVERLRRRGRVVADADGALAAVADAASTRGRDDVDASAARGDRSDAAPPSVARPDSPSPGSRDA
jgi:iron complex transport system ATP-binding protein